MHVCMLNCFDHVWIICNPTNCSLPGSSVHGMLQARILEWVTMPSSRGSSQPSDQTWISCIAADSLPLVPHGGEGDGTPLQYSCLENPMNGGAWKAAVHGVAKDQTRLSDFTFTFHLHALENEIAILSTVLAWRNPGTGEPGRLPSMGTHRVGHDWSDLAAEAGLHCCSGLLYFQQARATL